MPLERRDGYWLWIGGPVPKGSSGITIGPVVSVRRGAERSAYLLKHEEVHVRQWAQHGPVVFGVRYLWSYGAWRLARKGHWGAYRRIPYEVEADWVARRQLRAEARARNVPAPPA
jgi:hypothetical protein